MRLFFFEKNNKANDRMQTEKNIRNQIMDTTTKILMKTILKIGLMYIFSCNLYAKCSKEDVDYYLEKGFTT